MGNVLGAVEGCRKMWQKEKMLRFKFLVKSENNMKALKMARKIFTTTDQDYSEHSLKVGESGGGEGEGAE